MLSQNQGIGTKGDDKVRVFCVEPGTQVGRDENGKALIVTDTCAVNIGRTWWITKPAFGLVKEMTVQRIQQEAG